MYEKWREYTIAASAVLAAAFISNCTKDQMLAPNFQIKSSLKLNAPKIKLPQNVKRSNFYPDANNSI